MTRQTPAPIEHTNFEITHQRASALGRLVEDGALDLRPPYQRASVWDDTQRIALVESWLRGISIGSVVFSDRWTGAWRNPDGSRFDPVEQAQWACVDGQQRITTAIAWFTDAFAVPASWFEPEHVERTVPTGDGPYVHHSGLSLPRRRHLDLQATIQVETVKTATCVQDEAMIYLLRNRGGTLQTAADIDNARRVADSRKEPRP
ncbi:hypothetical protein H114_32654 [Streptomyces gancidicus BKS 13-15]|uniref:GmrSD restriction endonucleases N-terminal domain-containing protein n=1 Tax=Streptomyces gancidicus BKS 13-15 TaxID=1284664 RepID=M3DFH7_STREZ|nr:DUF262 domain-containing protein [Streptomyces gancidicus]EMF20392.1 hypothetical protein H114_32654 [Streptomyces gancidicus BKS 13-15]